MLSAVPALVSAEGFYAGGSIGFGEAEYSASDDFFFAEGDDTVAGVKAVGGYRINNFLAVEANLVGVANDEDDSFDEIEFAAISASAIFLVPVSEKFDLLFRGGYFVGESEVSVFDSEDESGFVVGGGGQVSFGSRKQFSIRMEYEYYDTDELQELWLLTGGFFYNF